MEYVADSFLFVGVAWHCERFGQRGTYQKYLQPLVQLLLVQWMHVCFFLPTQALIREKRCGLGVTYRLFGQEPFPSRGRDVSLSIDIAFKNSLCQL